MEDVPNLFGQARNDEIAPFGADGVKDADDGKTHGGVHVVDIVEAQHNRLNVGIFDDGGHGVLKEICGGKIKLSANANNAHFSVRLFFRANGHEAPLRVEGVFDEVGLGRLFQVGRNRNSDAHEKGDVETEDKTRKKGDEKDPRVFAGRPKGEFDLLNVRERGNGRNQNSGEPTPKK